MKVPKESIDSYFVQDYASIVQSKGFGCRIEQGTDNDSFFVSINSQRMRFPDTIKGRVDAASFINTNMLQMEEAMHKLLTMMKYCNNVHVGLATPEQLGKSPTGRLFSVELSGVYEPVKERTSEMREMITANGIEMVEVPDVKIVSKEEIFGPKKFDVFTGPQYDPSSFDSSRINALATEIGLRAIEADRIISENGGPTNAILNTKDNNVLRDLANNYQDNQLRYWTSKVEDWNKELYDYAFGYDDGTITLEEKEEALEKNVVEEVAEDIPNSPAKESFFTKVKQAISNFFHPEQKRSKEITDDDGGRDDI